MLNEKATSCFSVFSNDFFWAGDKSGQGD